MSKHNRTIHTLKIECNIVSDVFAVKHQKALIFHPKMHLQVIDFK